MALFPPQFIEDLKQQADIVVVIQDYVTLRKTGATYKGLCPFHSEKTPSFNVRPDIGRYQCFGCQTGGDAITWIRETQRLEFIDAVRLLAERQLATRCLQTDVARRERVPRRVVEVIDVQHVATAKEEDLRPRRLARRQRARRRRGRGLRRAHRRGHLRLRRRR